MGNGTKDGVSPDVKGKLRELIQEISEFDKECKATEHTDTVDAWDLLTTIKEKLVQEDHQLN